MRVCVFGAGAVGGVLAARLALSGIATAVVARGAHLAAIRANGLRYLSPEGEKIVHLPATDDPATLDPQDVVICTVKAHQLPAIAGSLAAVVRKETAVIYAVNGVPWWLFYKAGGRFDGHRLERLDPGGVLWDRVGAARAIGGVINLPASVVAPGVIRYEGGPNRLALGEPSGEDTGRLRTIAAVLRASGTPIDTHRPIRQEVWTKASRLTVAAALAILTASESSVLLHDATLRALHRRGWLEAIAVAEGLGVALDVDVDAGLDAMARLSGHRPSILQDFDAGRTLEIDAQIFAPLELGRLAGVATPTLEMLAALVVARLRAANLYSG